MNKIWLIIQREFLNRVQKKSFFIATILLPLIFPAIMAVLVYVKMRQEENEEKKIIYYVDENHTFKADTSKYIFVERMSSIEAAKEVFNKDSAGYALMYIPPYDLSKIPHFSLYTKTSLGPDEVTNLEHMLEDQIRSAKMDRYGLDRKLLDSLNTKVSFDTFILNEGQEESSNATARSIVGGTCGILIYMFVFIYGAQIMQGIIEEKTSKVVEVIISSVRPFQLMMGKIVGLASVGLLQFIIWILLIFTLSTLVLASFGLDAPQQEMVQQQQSAVEFANVIDQIPFTYIVVNFLFYFLGGYLLYGALFAAVGSAVDSPAEAQQFMFPITIPMLISYLCLFFFIIPDHDSPISVWLSIIPFTSPIAMMGRLPFGVPLWQLLLSQGLLVGGFVFTTWIAGRIYRVGILMHGTKVNYKVLAKWFMQRG